MSGSSDNLFDNEDLLSILNADMESKESLDSSLQDSDEIEQQKKLDEIKELSSQITSLNNIDVENLGSGDIDTDLSNWYDGIDSMPSVPLNQYVSNRDIKMEYGLSKNTITNYSMIGKLNHVIDDMFPLLFDTNALLSLTPSELEERMKLAFAMRDKLYSQSERAVKNLRESKLRGNDTDDVDKLRMLLSSISSDKLKAVLSELNK